MEVLLKPLSLSFGSYGCAVSKSVGFDLKCWTKVIEYIEEFLGLDLGEWLVRDCNPSNDLVIEDIDTERLEQTTQSLMDCRLG